MFDVENKTFVENKRFVFFTKNKTIVETTINLFKNNLQQIATNVIFLFVNFIANFFFNNNCKRFNSTKKYFKFVNVKFSNLKLNEFFKTKNIMTIKKIFITENVYLFIEKIKNIVIIYNFEIVKIDFAFCFCDGVQI